MKILHIMFDGYSPLNETRKISKDMFDLSMFDDYQRTDYVQLLNPKDDKPASIRQWFKFYSKVGVIKDPSMGRAPRTSLYEVQANTEDLLWNKLTDLGVVNLWRPVTYMHARDYDWMFGDYKSKTNLGFSTKDYRSTTGRHLVGGDFRSIRTDEIMAALMPAVKKDMHPSTWLYKDEETLAVAQEFSDSRGRESSLEAYEKLIGSSRFVEIMSNRIEELLSGNIKEYRNQIFPHFSEVLDSNNTENVYMHIGLEESACLAYMYPYSDIKKGPFKTYNDTVINDALSMMDYDIVIVTGDHGLCDMEDERSPHKYVFDSNKSGSKTGFFSSVGFDDVVGITKSWTTPLYPAFADHAYEVGATVFYKDKSKAQVLLDYIDNEVDYTAFDGEDVLMANQLDSVDSRSLLEIMHDALVHTYTKD